MCCGPVLQCLNAFPSRGPHWLIALKDNDFPTTLIPLGLFPLVRMCVVCAGLLPAWVQLESTAYWRHAVGTNPTSWLCILQHVAAHSNQKLWCLCAWQQARKIIKIHFSKAFFISQWKTWGVFFYPSMHWAINNWTAYSAMCRLWACEFICKRLCLWLAPL